MEKEESKLLLRIAKEAILTKLGENVKNSIQEKDIPSSLKEKRGSFVSLHKDKNLRGCIGVIEPIYPLFKSVYNNAISAAFSDPRFPAIKLSDLDNLEIEISVLTVPKKIEYKNKEELLKKIKPGIHGVILSKNDYSATFLPQVWEQLSDKKLFLSHLCQKAYLNPNEWEKGDLLIEVYLVKHFSNFFLNI